MNDKNINKYDHWLYGKCSNKTDTKGISNLIKFDFFEKSACIKKFFNSTEQKYFDIDDSKFRWPEIAHGTNNANIKKYTIFLESCKEDTLNLILGDNYHCKNVSELDKLFDTLRVSNLYFINNYINVLNYKNPITKFFHKLENGIYKDRYTINHLNFFPSKIKTNNGLIFDNIEEEISYIYDRSDVFTKDNNNSDIYAGYCFWLKNSMNYYERIYKRIQDVISSIGGFYQVINIVAVFINSFYHNYIILFDTRNLLISSINTEKNNYIKNVKNEKLKKKLIESKKEKIKNEIKNSSHRKKFINENTNNISYKNEKNKSDINISKSNNNCFTSYEDINNKSPKKIIKIENKDEIINPIIKNKESINFWNFILFKITCKKNNYKNYDDYLNFRKKIISEEHLIKNHLNVYNLLRITERKRNSRRVSFQFQNLINLA